MDYRELGKTGLRISKLGFGGIPIQRIDAAGTRALLLKLREEGVNFIDTARGYTVSESYIGEALDGMRQDFVLATKSMARTKDEMAAGKIGHIGVTAHLLPVFEQALALDWVETVMFPYNIVETQGEALISACAEKGVGFICMKPLAGGAIEDATLAMRFIARNAAVSVIIPGMAELAEIEQNVAAVNDTSPLTVAEALRCADVRQALGTHFCRRCNYCAPCPQGVNISGVFLMEGYAERYGLGDWARARYEAMPKKASDCVACGLCESRCPYELPIREMLRHAVETFGK